MGGQGSGGHNRLDPAEHSRRGNFRADRHGLTLASGEASGGVPDFDDWTKGLSKAARVQGAFVFYNYQFGAGDRQRFRHYCRAYAVRERLRARHRAEEGQVESWLWRISQRLAPWRRR